MEVEKLQEFVKEIIDQVPELKQTFEEQALIIVSATQRRRQKNSITASHD